VEDQQNYKSGTPGPSMTLSIIAAVSENHVIGKDNRLPWHLPADLKYFREKTTGHCVIMGRKNYESIPEKFRPLSNRLNIVVTRQKNYSAPGCTVANSIKDAINSAKQQEDTETFIIGGAEIYRQTIGLVDKLYITKIHALFEGDTLFPDIDWKTWKEAKKENFSADNKNRFSYSFLEFVRR
jgi:dihydrofolate reductase